MWIYFTNANTGWFGNQLYAYLTAKIINHITGHEVVFEKNVSEYYHTYTDWNWIDFEKKFLEDNTYRDPAFSHNIVLSGYFQRSKILNHFRDYLMSIFTPDNNDIITWLWDPIYKASDIIATPSNKKFTQDELVIHLRLGDFITLGQAIDPSVYFNEIQKLLESGTHISKYIIVCQPPENKVDEDYLNHFRKLEPVEIISNTQMEDFKTMQNAKLMICSNSTYSWLAAFFGNADKLLIARETIHTSPNLVEIGSNSKLFDITKRYKAKA